MTRFTTTAGSEPEARATELVDYLVSGTAPVNATTGQVRAIARLFQHRSIMKELAEGAEVDAQELADVATAELVDAGKDTVGELALRSLVNWLVVGAARVREVRAS